jgi:hypothetical protein
VFVKFSAMIFPNCSAASWTIVSTPPFSAIFL